jgi:streptogramin lyase
MNSKRTYVVLLGAALAASLMSAAADAPKHSQRPRATLLVSGLASGSGSTIGPDGALYVTEGAAGRVSRINPHNGHVSTFATGLPKRVVDIAERWTSRSSDGRRMSS